MVTNFLLLALVSCHISVYHGGNLASRIKSAKWRITHGSCDSRVVILQLKSFGFGNCYGSVAVAIPESEGMNRQKNFVEL